MVHARVYVCGRTHTSVHELAKTCSAQVPMPPKSHANSMWDLERKASKGRLRAEINGAKQHPCANAMHNE